MKGNKYSQEIPENVFEQAQAKIAEAAELMKPYVTTLTSTEVRAACFMCLFCKTRTNPNNSPSK